MSKSTRSISFKKRKEVDEKYIYPVKFNVVTNYTQNSIVMVEYKENEKVLIIGGNLPGLEGFYKNYPDVVEGDEQKEALHRLSTALKDDAIDFLSEYEPETSSSKSNSGNRSLNDIYVEVDEEQRDEVLLKMWKLLNYMTGKYEKYLQEHEPEKFERHDTLEKEIVRITMKSELT